MHLFLLKCSNINVNIYDKVGKTPLVYTIELYNLEIFNLLLNSGKVDLHALCNGRTALDFAQCQHRSCEDNLNEKSLTQIERNQTSIQLIYKKKEVMRDMIEAIKTILIMENFTQGVVANNMITKVHVTPIKQHHSHQALM